jgi:hypothetical protein
VKKLYLAWRDPGKRWFPVGELTLDGGVYAFSYLRGADLAAHEGGFRPLIEFGRFEGRYTSRELFPLFSNRIPSPSRPEYAAFVEWLSLRGDAPDKIDLLGRSAGLRATDTFEVFPLPERTPDGRYEVCAFIHGLRHRGPEAIARAERLAQGERLALRPEPGNVADGLAVQTLTADGSHHLGFLPRYLAGDVHRLGIDHVAAAVERVNAAPVPIQFRVLCHLSAPWPSDFEPCTGEEFEPYPVPVGR